MSTGAETDIWLVAPVGTVMHSFITWLSEIRYLLMVISGITKSPAKDVILS